METNPILEKIRSDEVKMRSKTYFKIKLFLLTVLAFLILTVSILICSFVLFSLRESGQSLLLGFGSHGFYLFLALFPWTIVMLAVALLVVLECLLRQFRFGYRSPAVYLLGALAVTVLIVSFVIDRTTLFHKTLLQRADKHNLPVFGSLYEDFRKLPSSHREICRCVVVERRDNVLIVRDEREVSGVYRTFLLPTDASTSTLAVGERVFIVGEESKGPMKMLGFQHLPVSDGN